MSRPTQSADKWGAQFNFVEKKVRTRLVISMNEEDVDWFKGYVKRHGTTMAATLRSYFAQLRNEEENG